MKCQRCQSERVATMGGKCSDMCSYTLNDSTVSGYVPGDMGVGDGDYLGFNYCLDCGQMQGKFPLPSTEIEKDISDEEVADFFDNHFTQGQDVNLPGRMIRDMIRVAKESGPKFGQFMENFFEYNTTTAYPPLKFPSCEKFVQMYRNGNAELDY